MPKAIEFKIPCENRPGTLAHIARILGDAKVNIFALLTTTAGAEGAVQCIVDQPQKARKALTKAGLAYKETPVLHIKLPNVPGALARFTQKLADKDINITCGYQTATKGARKAAVVLAVSDLDQAARVR